MIMTLFHRVILTHSSIFGNHAHLATTAYGQKRGGVVANTGFQWLSNSRGTTAQQPAFIFLGQLQIRVSTLTRLDSIPANRL